CRQLASRARRHVHDKGASLRGTVDPIEAQRVADRFIAAASSGDLATLLAVLDPEAAGWTDSGGAVDAPREKVIGRQRVAERLLWWLKTFDVTLVSKPINAGPGAIAMQDGEIIAAITINIDNGLITELTSVANPDKLGYVKAAMAARR